MFSTTPNIHSKYFNYFNRQTTLYFNLRENYTYNIRIATIRYFLHMHEQKK